MLDQVIVTNSLLGATKMNQDIPFSFSHGPNEGLAEKERKFYDPLAKVSLCRVYQSA
jgi:hypothetical protein